MTKIRLNCFGTLSVSIDDIEITKFRTDKVRALLGYLALNAERSHNRRMIATLLWPESNAKSVLSNMRLTIHRLRQTLDSIAPGTSDQLLHVTRHTLQFNSANAHVDELCFRKLLSEVEEHTHAQLHTCDLCLQRLTQAAALYQGELLADLSVGDAPEFEDWLLLRREIVHQRMLLVLITLTDAYESMGDYPLAQKYAERQLTIDPSREESHRQLIRILARRGLPDQAVAQYQRCRQMLKDELGISPSPETLTLIEQIKQGHFAQQETSPSSSLPPRTRTDEIRGRIAASHYHMTGLPSVDAFWGRSTELSQITHWLAYDSSQLHDSSQVVVILGIGGVGKTTLAAQTVHEIANNYDMVLWRSTVNAPTFDELLNDIVQAFAIHSWNELATTPAEQLIRLFSYLCERRVLLVLDNMESILAEEAVGFYRPGYEAYGELIQRWVMQPHQGHLILTSRERPHQIERWEKDSTRVHFLHLLGLDEESSDHLLQDRGVGGFLSNRKNLIQHYSGNPLALKLVADTVRELFAGDIVEFLGKETVVFEDIRVILDQQIARLQPLEQEILFWLAVARQPTTAQELTTSLLHYPPKRKVLEALRNLQRRSLITVSIGGFTLQNVVMEYLTDQLVDAAYQEIDSEEFNLLHRHALFMVGTKEYIRLMQVRLLLDPVAQRLYRKYSPVQLSEKLQTTLTQLRHSAPLLPSYAAGNILNLLLHVGIDLDGFDFSQLSVWQADLRNRAATNVNFAAADISRCAFTQTFSRIEAVAISPDDQLLAAGGDGGEIRFYRMEDGHPVMLLAGHTNTVTALAFSPDGSVLASTSHDWTLRLWDVASGHPIHLLDGQNPLLDVAFSPDGNVLASGAHDHTIRLWDVASGSLLDELMAPTKTLDAIAFHPGGKLVASAGSNGSIYLWHIDATGDTSRNGRQDNPHPKEPPFHILPVPEDLPIFSLAFSHDGRILASGTGSGPIILWDVESGQTLATLHDHVGRVWSLFFSRDNAILFSGGFDKAIRLWDISTRRCVNTLLGEQETIWSITLTQDGKTLASGSESGTICLWDVTVPRPNALSQILQGYSQSMSRVAWSPCGQWLATGDVRGAARLWDLAGPVPQCRHVLTGHTAVRSVAFSPDGKLLATAGEDPHHVIRVWDVASGQCLNELHSPTHKGTFVAFAPNNAFLVTGGPDGSIHVWSMITPTNIGLQRKWQAHDDNIATIAISADCKLLASSSNDWTVRLWDMSTGELLHELPGYGNNAGLAIQSNGSLLATSGPRFAISLWDYTDLVNDRPIRNLEGHTNHIYACAFSADGKQIVSGGLDCTLRLWDVESGKQVRLFGSHRQYVTGADFSPDGKRVASVGKEGSLRIWDVATGECLHILYAPGPYAGMNITGVTGISDTQRVALKSLGAVEE